MIFIDFGSTTACDENGIVTSFSEVAGGRDITIKAAIEDLQYAFDNDRICKKCMGRIYGAECYECEDNGEEG